MMDVMKDNVLDIFTSWRSLLPARNYYGIYAVKILITVMQPAKKIWSFDDDITTQWYLMFAIMRLSVCN